MNWIRLFLIILIILSGIFDLATFLYFHQFNAFEINPLWHLLKSTIFISLYKTAILTLFCIIIWKASRFAWLNYAIVLTALYNIAGQVWGGISNIRVAIENPPVSQAMSSSEAVRTYFLLALIYQVLPLIFGTLAFQLHKWGGYDTSSQKKKS
ncbi:MAG: hypothetical protein QXR60_03785 [Candidatus Nanoarchaeia archaeon]